MQRNRIDLEANLSPNPSFSRWKRFPLFGFIMAQGECELETEYDGTLKFEVECSGFKIDPGTVLQVLINEAEVTEVATVDGSSLALRQYERDGATMPQVAIGDTVRIIAQGETVFTGTFKQD